MSTGTAGLQQDYSRTTTPSSAAAPLSCRVAKMLSRYLVSGPEAPDEQRAKRRPTGARAHLLRGCSSRRRTRPLVTHSHGEHHHRGAVRSSAHSLRLAFIRAPSTSSCLLFFVIRTSGASVSCEGEGDLSEDAVISRIRTQEAVGVAAGVSLGAGGAAAGAAGQTGSL